MDINKYLKRIGVHHASQPYLKTLQHLQHQHMLNVPFENLDVIRGISIPLHLETYYKKIVLNQRGGFCYELNGLFHWLLKNLGYRNYLISATVLKPNGSWAMHGSHASQIVELEQPYLVDVGFGNSARQPLPLTGEKRTDISGTYRVVKVNETTYDLTRLTDTNEWGTLFRFETTPRKLHDFKEACQFNQTSPNSHFTRESIVSLATDHGRVTLSEGVLTITQDGEKNKKIIHEHEQNHVLETYFHMT